DTRADGLDFSRVGIYGTAFDFCDFTVFKFMAPREDAQYERYARLVREATDRGQTVLVGLYTFDRVTHSRPVSEYIANTDALLSHLDPKTIYAVFLSEENVTWNNGLAVLNELYDHVKRKYGLTVYQWYTPYDVPHPKQKADGWIIDPYRWRSQEFRKYLLKYVLTGKPVINCINASPEIEPWEASQDQVDVCREFNIPMFFYCVDPEKGSPYIWLRSDDPRLARWRSWFFETRAMAHATDASRLPLPSADYSPGRPVEVAGDEDGRFQYVENFGGLTFVDDATINRFRSIRWDGQREALALIARGDRPVSASLAYHLFSEFEMRRPSVEARFEATDASRATLRLSMSRNGRDWRDVRVGEPLPDFAGRNVWVRFAMSADEGRRGQPAAWLREFAIRGECVPPAAREVRLVPFGRGTAVEYRDDFQAQRYLHLARIEGARDLQWQRGRLGIRGADGRTVRATLRWKFTADRPLRDIRVAIESYSHRLLGAHNEFGVSLDGANVVATQTTTGKEAQNGRYVGTIEFDLSENPRFKDVSEFWVHAAMINSAGKRTNPSNDLRLLRVSARLAPPAEPR
ncbi:MAG: hypothetical protein ACE5O2_09435, partial [Armatimonadota bacterium]